MLQFIKSTVAFIGVKFYSAANKVISSPSIQKSVAAFWLGFFAVSDAMASSKGRPSLPSSCLSAHSTCISRCRMETRT